MEKIRNTLPVDVMRAAYLEGVETGRRGGPLVNTAGWAQAFERAAQYAAPVFVVGVAAPVGLKLGRLTRALIARHRSEPTITKADAEDLSAAA